MRIPVVAAVLLLGTALTVPSASALHTWDLVEPSAATNKGVIAGVNAHLGSQRPEWCFRVRVARSHADWATFGWSEGATGKSPCFAFDGITTFFRKTSGRTWVYAGDGPGWNLTKCTFRVRPPRGVPADFGCHWWKVKG